MACSIVCVHNLYSQDYYYRQITCSIMFLCNNLILCFPQPLCYVHYTLVLFYFFCCQCISSKHCKILVDDHQSVMLLLVLATENIEFVESIMSGVMQIMNVPSLVWTLLLSSINIIAQKPSISVFTRKLLLHQSWILDPYMYTYTHLKDN